MNEIEIRHVVGAILVNDAGDVLLQQRDDKPGLRYAGYWTIFGGSVEAGETFEEAIQRELIEELQLELPLAFWMEYECPVRTIKGEVVTYNHLYIGRMTRSLDSLTLYEGQAMAYFNREEAARLTLAYEQSWVVESYFRQQMEGVLP